MMNQTIFELKLAAKDYINHYEDAGRAFRALMADYDLSPAESSYVKEIFLSLLEEECLDESA